MVPPIRNRLRVPAVRRVRELLRAVILQHRLASAVLPSELELMAAYGVSRSVMREVLELLRAEGLVQRLQGAGTFVVAPDRTALTLGKMDGLLSSVAGSTSRVSWELITLDALPAPVVVASRLDLVEGQTVYYIERRTWLDGEPVALRSSWIPADIGDGLLAGPGHARRSVYELVEDALGHDVVVADVRIEATLADAATAPLLNVRIHDPLILLERLVRDCHERPVEYGFSRLRGDRIALTTVLGRRDGDVA